MNSFIISIYSDIMMSFIWDLKKIKVKSKDMHKTLTYIDIKQMEDIDNIIPQRKRCN